jgi:hypothetical protein
MTDLPSLRRRQATRKSGQKVKSGTTGGKCKLRFSDCLDLDEQSVLKFSVLGSRVPALFRGRTGIVAFAGYVNPSSSLDATIRLSASLGESNREGLAVSS